MTELVEIDTKIFSELRSAVGDEFLEEMINTFCEDSEAQATILKKTLAHDQQSDFIRAAHTLKSTSLIFGAVNFGALARELEQLGRDDQLESTRPEVELLCDSLNDLQKRLKDLCHE